MSEPTEKMTVDLKAVKLLLTISGLAYEAKSDLTNGMKTGEEVAQTIRRLDSLGYQSAKLAANMFFEKEE